MVLAQLQEKYVTYVIIWAVSMFKNGQTYQITSCHGACNSESIAAINTQFFALQCYVHKLIYSLKIT